MKLFKKKNRKGENPLLPGLDLEPYLNGNVFGDEHVPFQSCVYR